MPDVAANAVETAVPGLQRGLAVIELLARNPLGRTLSELSDELGVPAATVFRIGNTLETLGYVDRDPTTKRFTLTTKLMHLAQPATSERQLSECAIEPMRSVRRATGETTQLCCLIDTDIVIVEQLLATHAFKYSADIGARCPTYSSAPGKAIAAFLPATDRNQLVGRLKLKRFTPTTITTKAAFRDELARIREAGFAVDRAEGMLGIHCVAAPILDRHGAAIAALTIAGPADRIPEDEFASFGAAVVDAAKQTATAFDRGVTV